MIEMQIQVTGGLLTLDEIAGNMVLHGEDRTDVLFKSRDGQEQNLRVEDTDAGPVVSAQMNCEIRVPPTVTVSVRQVTGNLRAKGLTELNAEQVRGNLWLQAVSRADLAEVYGNLKAEETDSLRIVGTVYGDALLKAVRSIDIQNVRGNMQVKASDQMRVSRMGGNLQAREVLGPLDVDRVGGNALAGRWRSAHPGPGCGQPGSQGPDRWSQGQQDWGQPGVERRPGRRVHLSF